MALTKRRSLFFLCLICFLKEALFLVLAPFFPDLLKQKNISSYYYAPIFMYDNYSAHIFDLFI
jgi:hypothetical protein